MSGAQQNIDHAFQAAKTGGDILSVSVALGTLVDFLPALAALFTIIWTAIRIWETATVQRLVKRIRRRA